jgi:hypothetical protein
VLTVMNSTPAISRLGETRRKTQNLKLAFGERFDQGSGQRRRGFRRLLERPGQRHVAIRQGVHVSPLLAQFDALHDVACCSLQVIPLVQQIAEA